MREVNVHDLGLDDAEQELLALSEGRQRPRQRQTPLFENPVNDDNGDGVGLSWVFAVIVLFLIGFGLATVYQNDAVDHRVVTTAGVNG